MTEISEDLFFLKWNDYTSEMMNSFHKLRSSEQFTDVTIACENRSITRANGFKKFRLFKAHKILLCVSSPYFREMLADNPSTHPIIMMREAQAEEIEGILKFIYTGQVHIRQENLDEFIRVAKYLKIRGLVKVDDDKEEESLPPATAAGAANPTDGSTRKRRPARIKYQEDVVDDNADDSDFDISEFTKPDMPLSARKKRRSSAQKKAAETKSELIEDRPEAEGQPEANLAEEFGEDNNLDSESSRSAKPPCPVAQRGKTTPTTPGAFECPHCDRTYKSHNSLILHQHVHTGATTCRLCKKVLSRPLELKRHMRQVHDYESDEDDDDDEDDVDAAEFESMDV